MIDSVKCSRKIKDAQKVRNLASFKKSLKFEPPAFESTASSSSSRSRDMEGPKILKVGHVTPSRPPLT